MATSITATTIIDKELVDKLTDYVLIMDNGALKRISIDEFNQKMVELATDLENTAVLTEAELQVYVDQVEAIKDDTQDIQDATDVIKSETQDIQDATTVTATSIGIYSSTAAGISATTNGQYFSVLDNTNNRLSYYRNDTGVAELVAEYPSLQFIADRIFNPYEEVAFAITDDDGRKSWIQFDANGLPTGDSASLISAAIVANTNDISDAVNQIDPEHYNTDNVFVVADGTGTRSSWIQVNSQGLPGSYAREVIKDVAAERYTAGPDIVCWGDSMTAGPDDWPGRVQTIIGDYATSGIRIWNAGVGGEDSGNIIARANALPFVVDVTGGTIPTSGGVTVTFKGISEYPYINAQPLLQGDTYEDSGDGVYGEAGDFAILEGTLYPSEVHGAITYSGGTYTFTRTTAGSSVVADRPQTMITDFGEARRKDRAIIFLGANNGLENVALPGGTYPKNTDAGQVTALYHARLLADYLDTAEREYIVIPSTRCTEDQEKNFINEFGHRVLILRQYMVDYGLTDAGITPTAQDLLDISSGVVPQSLRDIGSVHFNNDGKDIAADLIHKKMKQLGWI